MPPTKENIMMATLNHTHTIYSQTDAAELAAEMNADTDDDWVYVVENNPLEDGPKTAIIRIYDEEGEFVALL